MKLKPTKEQQLILDAVQKDFDVLIAEAGAGTGKTKTLEMIAGVMKGRGQYTAFNSPLVNESKAKFRGTRVSCNTTHSLAFRAEGKRFSHRLGGQRVKSEQIARMLHIEPISVTVATGYDEVTEKRIAPGFLAGHVMGAVKRFCQSADREISVNHFKYIDGIDMPTEDGCRTYENNGSLRERLLPYARKAWTDLTSEEGQLPFSHDHYVKIWQLNKPVISADYIMLDEAQDTAPVMLDILRQQDCPVILVGDSAQQIYEWRGAVNAMAEFGDATRLYLSQSFRFGEAIAAVANAVLDTLEEPTALRLKGLPSIPSVIEPIDDPDCVLCRTNAAAISTLLSALEAERKPFLVGGGSDVIAFVKGARELQNGNATGHPDLACFDSWKEVQEYSKTDDGEDLQLMVKLIDGFGADTIIDALSNMVEEEDADLVICTAHKSKGREWDRVKLAGDFPTQSKCGDAERRLLYVAVTRAKLVLDTSECPFFTGQDSMDISSIDIKPIATTEEEGILPPTPSKPPIEEPEGFTWARDKHGDRGWLVRGPKGKSGETVEVFRRDGSSSRKKLASVVWENGTVALYEI